jgi:pyruvate formate lyase activating enzyme
MIRNSKVKNILEKKKISRREFLKKAVIFGAGIGTTSLTLNCLLKSPSEEKITSTTLIEESMMTTSTTTSAPKISLKEAMYYDENLDKKTVRCGLCPNRCFIAPEQRGICGVRVNKKGKLYTLGYENPCALHIDPIEKKPLFHFLPKSLAFSLAIAGCSLRCKYCQNWQISQAKPDETRNIKLTVEDAVSGAMKNNARSIAYTYTEPTVFYEYMIDIAKIAKEKGVKNVIVTCGYMNSEPLEELCKYLDGGNVNLKGFSNEFYKKLTNGRLEPILETMKILHEKKIWFEITYLVIPGWNDDNEQIKNFIKWVKDKFGEEKPIHFLRFSPAFKMMHVPPTPVNTLEKARNLAFGEGLKYVYIGNAPGHEGENTYCSNCSKIVIKRKGFIVEEISVEKKGTCKFCGNKIPGIWS